MNYGYNFYYKSYCFSFDIFKKKSYILFGVAVAFC